MKGARRPLQTNSDVEIIELTKISNAEVEYIDSKDSPANSLSRYQHETTKA